jgi:1,4-alpha-glucan branching enzyme
MAEESTTWPQVSRPTYAGGLGFTFKWNMGWMHDVLHYIAHDPIHRRFHHNELTFSLMYAFTENFILPFSHDEVVHLKASMLSKMPGDTWQKFANLRAIYAYMYGHPGKKLLFMGGEFGQLTEWSEASWLPWHLLDAPAHQPSRHTQLRNLVADLNTMLATSPALYELDSDPAGFEWIDCNDADSSVVVFVRSAVDRHTQLLFACNFTPMPRYAYRIGVTRDGYYDEILNTDARAYGGSNLGNQGGMWSERVACHGRADSISITLPPLATVVFRIRETPPD